MVSYKPPSVAIKTTLAFLYSMSTTSVAVLYALLMSRNSFHVRKFFDRIRVLLFDAMYFSPAAVYTSLTFDIGVAYSSFV